MKNILAAFMFFTRLPFWRIATVEKEHFKNVVNYWPYAGIITGATGAGVMLGASYLFPVTVAVILGVAARVLVTGALHEDGLADFFDGFGGHLKIIPAAGEGSGQPIVRILHIRQINIHKTVQ